MEIRGSPPPQRDVTPPSLPPLTWLGYKLAVLVDQEEAFKQKYQKAHEEYVHNWIEKSFSEPEFSKDYSN